MINETNDISEKFIEAMVDKVINRLTAKLDQLDISMDYIGALLSGQATQDVGVAQKQLGRFAGGDHISTKAKVKDD
jgi:hypothetical protein